jgi:hypothetical protein
MLTGLRIGNFKAFAEEQHIPIRPITLIFGANSSGKSSILHSLLLANHALETGDWDVHQPRLGAESVDLGGFPHYVHQHQPAGGFLLHFESDLSHVNLMKVLVGAEAEKKPFCGFRRFGLSLRVGKSGGDGTATGVDNALAIQTAEITFDGAAAFGFTRTGPDLFQCNRVNSEHSVIRRLLQEMPEFARRKSEGDEATTRKVLADMMGEPATAEGAGEEAADSAEAAALREEFPRPSGSAPLVDEATELAKRLAEVLAERQFRLKQDYLSDEGPDGGWDWAGWREWMAEDQYGGVLGFFSEVSGKDESWALAQAIRYNLTRLIAVLTALTSKELHALSYLGPQRVVPPRHLLVLAQDSPGSSGSGLEAWQHVCGDIRAQEIVNRWFGAEWLGLPYRLKVRRLVYADEPASDAGIPELMFEDSGTGTRLSHRDLGFGVTQALPVLVSAAALTNRIIAVEQPELHLHPAQQAELGDVFIESALGERKNTFLLETHSEHLILRIMKRIRQTKAGKLEKGLPAISPADVSVLYVEKVGTRSLVREFPLNERGELVKAWPGGFFEEGLREVLG